MIHHHIFVRLIFSSLPSCFLSGHAVVYFRESWATGIDSVRRWNMPQILQAHAFMILQSKKLVAWGEKEVSPTNQKSDLLAVVLLLSSSAPLFFFCDY